MEQLCAVAPALLLREDIQIFDHIFPHGGQSHRPWIQQEPQALSLRQLAAQIGSLPLRGVFRFFPNGAGPVRCLQR